MRIRGFITKTLWALILLLASVAKDKKGQLAVLTELLNRNDLHIGKLYT